MSGPDASVRCVRCGEPLAGVTSDYCPRCGMPVSASLGVGQLPQAPAAPEPAGSGDVPTTAAGGYEAPPFPPAPPPAAPYPQYPPAQQPQQPPTYPPYPSYPYGQPAAPSMPLSPPAGYPTGYPQFAPPSLPLPGQYGQPAGPSVPYYGQPAGPSVPYYGPPGMPAPWTVPLAPAKKSRTGLIVGLLVALLVVVAGGGTAAVLALSHNGTGAGASGTPTATSGPTATATPNILFQDALTSNVNGWADDANCFFKSDGYHSKGYICFAPYTPPNDADIALDAVQISGDIQHARGIGFRHQSQGNFYVFGVTGDGYWVFYKVVNGTGTIIHDYTANSIIRQGLNTSNTLRVVAKGTQFTFYVNSTLVGSATDATFSSGVCGVASATGTEDVFRNLIIASDG